MKTIQVAFRMPVELVEALDRVAREIQAISGTRKRVTRSHAARALIFSALDERSRGGTKNDSRKKPKKEGARKNGRKILK